MCNNFISSKRRKMNFTDLINMIIYSSGICCSGLAYKSYISFGSFMKANTHEGLLHLKNHTKIFAYWKTDSNKEN